MGSDATAKASIWRPGQGINLHKLLVGPFAAALMWKYACFTTAAWTYLALHTTYGLLWVAKEVTFPDARFQEPCSFGMMVASFIITSVLYCPIPWILVNHHAESVPEWYPPVAIAAFNSGMFLMLGSDGQKYFTLKLAPNKLITSGFFKYIRNPNFLGELLIYSSFSMLTYTPWGFVPTLMFVLTGLIPRTTEKERSMSRYPEYADWKASTYSVLPPFF